MERGLTEQSSAGPKRTPARDASRFPVRTALAMVTAGVLLAGYRQLVDPAKGLGPGLFREAARLRLGGPEKRAHRAVPTVQEVPPVSRVAGGQGSGTGLKVVRTPISLYLIDDTGVLDPFFAALHELELPAPARGPLQVVRVLHYGDSPTTADLITGDVRALLQKRFGDAGRGYLLTGKPWAWYGHRGSDLVDHGWEISTAVGKGRAEVYGLGGASFEGGPGASSRITLDGEGAGDEAGPAAGFELAYLARPEGGTLAVSADGTALESVATAAGEPHPEWRSFALPHPASKDQTIELRPTAGAVRLFGEEFTSGRRGVIYSSLGLNGASTSVLSSGFDADAWSAELEHTAPQLVIINYGTNESGFGAYVDKTYEGTLRGAIGRIRAALPGVAILVMSPMDRGRRVGGAIETYDTIPRLVAIERRVAAELGCAFFDTFDAMGGEGTMAEWYNGHPRLVAGDLIHPSPQGAALVAGLFVHDLSLGYERYLRGLAKVPAVAGRVPPN